MTAKDRSPLLLPPALPLPLLLLDSLLSVVHAARKSGAATASASSRLGAAIRSSRVGAGTRARARLRPGFCPAALRDAAGPACGPPDGRHPVGVLGSRRGDSEH